MRSLLTRAGLATLVLLSLPVSALAQADLTLEFIGSSDASGCGSGPCGPGPYTVTPGGVAVYYVNVTNLGPNPASNVVATLTFPPHTSIIRVLPLLGSAACSSSLAGSNPVITCTQGSLASGGSFSVHILLGLDTDYPWQDGLSASASVTSATPDPVSSNNSATVSLYVAPPAGAAVAPTLDLWAVTLLIAVLALAAILRIAR